MIGVNRRVRKREQRGEKRERQRGERREKQKERKWRIVRNTLFFLLFRLWFDSHKKHLFLRIRF